MNYRQRTQKAKRNEAIRHMTAKEKGRDAWFIVELYPNKYIAYKRQLRLGSILLKDFGTILASGWGEKAPPELLKRYHLC